MDRIQLRRDTSARWTEINPILLEGEIGYEIDTKLRKIGDGVNRWNDLEYLKAEGISQETGDSENATMSQKAITNEFSELGSKIGIVNTSEEQGGRHVLVSFKAGHTYSISVKEGGVTAMYTSNNSSWDAERVEHITENVGTGIEFTPSKDALYLTYWQSVDYKTVLEIRDISNNPLKILDRIEDISPINIEKYPNVEKVSKIDTQYEVGLLISGYGNVGVSQNSYLTSDFIVVERDKLYSYYSTTNSVISDHYTYISVYDKNKVHIKSSSINKVIKGHNVLSFTDDVAYIKFSVISDRKEVIGIYKGDNEDFSTVVPNINNINNSLFGVVDFGYKDFKIIDAEYEQGLLDGNGNINESLTDYSTSNFIEVNKSNIYEIRTKAINIVNVYPFVCFYDSDYKFLYGEFGNAKYKSDSQLLNIREDVAYIRYVIVGEKRLQGLYSTKVLSPSRLYADILSNASKNSFIEQKGLIDDSSKIEEVTYFTNARLEGSKNTKINADGFCIAVLDVTEELKGKLISYKGIKSPYVPCLRFYEGRSDDFMNFYGLVFSSDAVTTGLYNEEGSIIIPPNANVLVVQANLEKTDELLQKESCGFFHYNVKLLHEKSKALRRIKNLLQDEPSEDLTHDKFDDFVDRNELVGTYLYNKRVSTNGNITIESDGFCTIVLTEKDIKENSYINVVCSTQTYVPGVLFYDSYAEDFSSFGKLIKISIKTEEAKYSPTPAKKQLSIPNGTKAIVVQCYPKGLGVEMVDEEHLNDIKNVLCASFTSCRFIGANEFEEKLKELSGKSNNCWTDKNIWWCGTSIPAAGYWNVDNKWSYPYMVGQILNAKRVFNEAVGSSCANGNMKASSYEVSSRRMGNTIAEKLQIFNDCWTIDDVNKTVVNGPRTLGITSIPTITTYSDACWYRKDIISHSYEIKLVSKYLISDTKENESYLRSKFGNLYDILIGLHPTAYNYKGDIDLFVIDHSNNEGVVGYEDINSTDITTYVGALNTYVRLIFQYKPHARVAFISNYVDAPSGVIKVEGDIADNWNLPYLNLLKYLNLNTKFKILTRGYWDENSMWHDEGFEWSDDGSTYETNLYLEGMSSRVKGNLSLSQVKANINPQQIDGVWYWEGYQRDIRIRDGLHPHTDKTGRCFRMYSEVIAEFLKTIGS